MSKAWCVLLKNSKRFCFHEIHSKTGTPFGCCKFLFDVLNYFVD